VIKTLRMFLEPVTAKHAAPMFAGLQDQRAYRYLEEGPPESIAELQSRYELLTAQISPNGKEIWLNWMLKRRGAEHYVGYVQATVFPKQRIALVAYHIFPAFWGQHLAREAVKGMLAAIGPEYDLVEARAHIDTRNKASIKVVESLGFELCGTVTPVGPGSDEYLYILKLGS
jgi:ribosomal-protein-alanine N-acetyltransferase